MSSGDMASELVEEFTALRRQEARLVAKIAEADRAGEAAAYGTLSKLVADVGRCGRSEARRLAERARVLHERVGLSGTPIPAVMPHTTVAYADGAIGSEHVDKIRALAEELPADVLADESWPIAEQALAEHARTIGPRGLTRPIREFAARLDPDGQQPNEHELAQPQRQLRLIQRRTRIDLDGFVDIETGLKLQALLDTLAKPHSRTANEGQPDSRTTAQRHGDALAEVIQLATVSKELPESGGEPFTILLTAPEAALTKHAAEPDSAHGSNPAGPRNRAHAPETAAAMDGTRIPAAGLQRIACDATFVTKDGKQRRSAPPALRRALIARDQGCAHPDCDAPPALCHAHHIHHHAIGGETSVVNMVLLCGHHHRLIHHTEWKVHMRHGTPTFTPPDYRCAHSTSVKEHANVSPAIFTLTQEKRTVLSPP